LNGPQVDSIPQERGQIGAPESMQRELLALTDIAATIASTATHPGTMRQPLERSQQLRVWLSVLCAQNECLISPGFLPCFKFKYQIVRDGDFALLPSLRKEAPLVFGLHSERLIRSI
jgi:hypothetical protein